MTSVKKRKSLSWSLSYHKGAYKTHDWKKSPFALLKKYINRLNKYRTNSKGLHFITNDLRKCTDRCWNPFLFFNMIFFFWLGSVKIMKQILNSIIIKTNGKFRFRMKNNLIKHGTLVHHTCSWLYALTYKKISIDSLLSQMYI